MSKKILRRSFLGTAGTAAALAASQNASAAFHPIPLVTRGRLEKPTLLGIGAGGKGTTDLEQCHLVLRSPCQFSLLWFNQKCPKNKNLRSVCATLPEVSHIPKEMPT